MSEADLVNAITCVSVLMVVTKTHNGHYLVLLYTVDIVAMGVAKILESGGFGRHVIRLTSRDNGDVTRITACSSPHS